MKGATPNRQNVTQPPKAEAGSVGGQFDNGSLTAEQLAAAGLLDPSLTNPQNRETGANEPKETINAREQFRTLFSTPAEAGRQVGLNGIIFDRSEDDRKKSLDQRNQEVQKIAQAQAEQARTTSRRDPATEQEIQQLTKEARKQSRRNNAATLAAGRAQTLSLQSEQTINNKDKSTTPLLRRMIGDMLQSARRKKQLEAHQIQAERQNKKKAASGMEGNADKKSSAIAEMRSQGSTEDQSGDSE